MIASYLLLFVLLLFLLKHILQTKDYYIVEHRTCADDISVDSIGGCRWWIHKTSDELSLKKYKLEIRFFDSSLDIRDMDYSRDSLVRTTLMGCDFKAFEDIGAAELYFDKIESDPDRYFTRQLNNLWCVNALTMKVALKKHIHERIGVVVKQTPHRIIMKREEEFQKYIENEKASVEGNV